MRVIRIQWEGKWIDFHPACPHCSCNAGEPVVEVCRWCGGELLVAWHVEDGKGLYLSPEESALWVEQGATMVSPGDA